MQPIAIKSEDLPPDVFTLRLRRIVEWLEDDICDQRSGEAVALPGVQPGHIRRHNGSPHLEAVFTRG